MVNRRPKAEGMPNWAKVDEMQGIIIWWRPEATHAERGGQGVISVTQDGILQKYFLLQSRIARSPVIIRAGQIARFAESEPAPRPGLLPIALSVEIFNPNEDVTAGVTALEKDGGR